MTHGRRCSGQNFGHLGQAAKELSHRSSNHRGVCYFPVGIAGSQFCELFAISSGILSIPPKPHRWAEAQYDTDLNWNRTECSPTPRRLFVSNDLSTFKDLKWGQSSFKSIVGRALWCNTRLPCWYDIASVVLSCASFANDLAIHIRSWSTAPFSYHVNSSGGYEYGLYGRNLVCPLKL